MMPKIVFALYDGLADVYAMKTLHDYLAEKDFPAQMEFAVIGDDFNYHSKRSIAEGILGPLQGFHEEELEEELNPDIIVTGFSDVSCCFDFKNRIRIDLSILKNCVKPVSKKERERLRKKYEIPAGKPIFVIANPSGYEHPFSMQKKQLKEILDLAEVYLVGMFSNAKDFSKAKQVKQYGVMKDYYAATDASLMEDTLDGKVGGTIHNFIEATAGGPLFLGPRADTAQYGYEELVDLGVIRKAETNEELVSKIKEYLKNPNSAHFRALRAGHLRNSRKKYLEDIAIFLARTLKFTDKKPSSDLMIKIEDSGRSSSAVKILHPKTRWDVNHLDGAIPITKVSDKVYEMFRRRK